MKVSSWKERVGRIVMAAALLLVTACAVIVTIDSVGGTFHYEGYVGQLPPGAKPMGLKVKAEVPGMGWVDVKVYDTDGDGEADMGGPVPPTNKYFKGSVSPKQQLVAGPGPSQGVGVQIDRHDNTFVPYLNPPENPMPVVFEKSVSESLTDHGIEQVIEGDNVASNAIEVLGAAEDLGLPSGLRLDVRLHWNTAAGWVDIEQFPSLQYEFHGLAEVPHTWPGYMVARVVGDGAAVLNWLGHFGFTELDAYGLQIEGGPAGLEFINHLGIVIHTAAGFAQVSVDGVTSYVVLGW